MVMHGWPEDFHFRHLKRAVLVNMIEKRKEFMDDSFIVKHLNKSQYSYKDAVLEIKNRDADEPIPQYLGDFIVAAISKTIGRTIVVIKPKIETTTDVNNRPLVKYLCYTEYLFGEDKGAGKGCDLIMLVWNGLDYFANAIPKHIINLTRSASNALNFIAEATEQINDIIDSVPPSDTRTTMSKALRAMGAAKGYLAGTRLATGTTVEAELPKEVTVARPVPAATAAKYSRKRSSAVLQLAPPERKQKESDAEWKKRRTEHTAKLDKAAKRCVTKDDNQCACGEVFRNKKELDEHIMVDHPNKKAWKCSKCEAVLGNKEHCWGHVRHHFGKYYHYCDVTYEDKDEKDKDGNPVKKVCEKGFDEFSLVDFHREVEHKFGKCKIRCSKCDKPQMSNRKLQAHEKICKAKADEKTDFCEYCTYGCRGKDTLLGHIKAEHSKEIGLPAPRRYVCAQCQKQFKSASGVRGHTCKKEKPSAATGKRK